MDEPTVYKDDNSCESGASSPETVWASLLAGPSRTEGACSSVNPERISQSAWDVIAEGFPSSPLGRPEWPDSRPLPDYSLILIALAERARCVADGVRHKKLFDARDAAYQVEFLGKLLRLSIVHELNAYINPAPKRAGVFVTDAEVG